MVFVCRREIENIKKQQQGNKEEDRQGVEVKQRLKRRHQNDEN